MIEIQRITAETEPLFASGGRAAAGQRGSGRARGEGRLCAGIPAQAERAVEHRQPGRGGRGRALRRGKDHRPARWRTCGARGASRRGTPAGAGGRAVRAAGAAPSAARAGRCWRLPRTGRANAACAACAPETSDVECWGVPVPDRAAALRLAESIRCATSALRLEMRKAPALRETALFFYKML